MNKKKLEYIISIVQKRRRNKMELSILLLEQMLSMLLMILMGL